MKHVPIACISLIVLLFVSCKRNPDEEVARQGVSKRELNREEKAYSVAFDNALEVIHKFDESFDSRVREGYEHLVRLDFEWNDPLSAAKSDWEGTRIPPKGFQGSYAAIDSAFVLGNDALNLRIRELLVGSGGLIESQRTRLAYCKRALRDYLETAKNRFEEEKARIAG